jgi:hypothetical protein
MYKRSNTKRKSLKEKIIKKLTTRSRKARKGENMLRKERHRMGRKYNQRR